jgi:hypothetical protein
MAQRICIYSKDITTITGKSEQYSREIINKIKKHLKKKPHQLVTIDEFCVYMALPKQDVVKLIKD